MQWGIEFEIAANLHNQRKKRRCIAQLYDAQMSSNSAGYAA